jgi:hypothetical protein
MLWYCDFCKNAAMTKKKTTQNSTHFHEQVNPFLNLSAQVPLEQASHQPKAAFGALRKTADIFKF